MDKDPPEGPFERLESSIPGSPGEAWRLQLAGWVARMLTWLQDGGKKVRGWMARELVEKMVYIRR